MQCREFFSNVPGSYLLEKLAEVEKAKGSWGVREQYATLFKKNGGRLAFTRGRVRSVTGEKHV